MSPLVSLAQSSLTTLIAKIAPALATGNAIVIKPSEITPPTAIRTCQFMTAAGFPDGVVNVVTGYGPTVGDAISHHPCIDKVMFTSSIVTGKKIMQAEAASNFTQQYIAEVRGSERTASPFSPRSHINPDMTIMKEEIFGPVGAVVKFEYDEDIIKKANDTIYGLATYVFSQNVTKAIESGHKLKAGSMWVNMGAQ